MGATHGDTVLCSRTEPRYLYWNASRVKASTSGRRGLRHKCAALALALAPDQRPINTQPLPSPRLFCYLIDMPSFAVDVEFNCEVIVVLVRSITPWVWVWEADSTLLNRVTRTAGRRYSVSRPPQRVQWLCHLPRHVQYPSPARRTSRWVEQRAPPEARRRLEERLQEFPTPVSSCVLLPLTITIMTDS
jgi:hypothetical protein